jgi:hypothetical protein
MGGEIKQRHHLKAMLISGLVLIVVVFVIMSLKGQADKAPVPADAVSDVKSTQWTKFGSDPDGDHFYRFDASSKNFPDVLSVKTRLVYNEEGKKRYVEARRKAKLPAEGLEQQLDSRTVLYGLNCVSKQRELCVLEVFELTKDGKTLDYAKTGSYKDWSHIPPGTVYEELARIICPDRKQP